MKINDAVRVVGPSESGMSFIGKEFKITEARVKNGRVGFSANNVAWFPESSLMLINETYDRLTVIEKRLDALESSKANALKAGDWVEIVGPGVPDSVIGKIFRISNVWKNGNRIENTFYSVPTHSARRLSDDEISRRLNK